MPEIVTDEMVEAFGDAWEKTPAGEPGARRRAGLVAAMNASPWQSTIYRDEMAGQHDEEPSSAPLFTGVEFVERVLTEGRQLHVCRGQDGEVYVYCETDEVAALTQDEVRWLAGILTAALDNWPSQG